MLSVILLGLVPSLLAQPRMLLDAKMVIQQYKGESFCNYPMTELAFEELRASIKRLPNERLKFEKIRTEIGSQCLITPYLYQLMGLFENPTIEYDMLRLAFYYTFDVENFDNLVPYMQGQVYQDRMEEFLKERNHSQRADVEGKRQILSPSELTRALQVLAEFPSDQTRLVVAKQFVATNNLYAEQLREVVAEIRMVKKRVELIQFGYHHVYDPANYYAVYETLRGVEFDNVNDYVREHNRGKEEKYMSSRELGCTFLVTKSDFETHKNTIKAKKYDSERLRFAKNLMTTYCFNVGELVDCLALFKSDADRLELAQEAYAHIYDPWNFYLVNQSFKSLTTIERLDKFLNAR